MAETTSAVLPSETTSTTPLVSVAFDVAETVALAEEVHSARYQRPRSHARGVPEAVA